MSESIKANLEEGSRENSPAPDASDSDTSVFLASQIQPILIKRLQEDKPIDDIEKTLKAYKELQDSSTEKDKQAFLRERALRKQSFYFSFLVAILTPLLVITLSVSRLSSQDDKVSLYLLGAGSGILAVSASVLLSEQAQTRKK